MMMGIMLTGEGHLHACATERAVAAGDLAVILLLDDLHCHRQAKALAGAQRIDTLPRLKISAHLLSGMPGPSSSMAIVRFLSECSEVVIPTNSRQYL